MVETFDKKYNRPKLENLERRLRGILGSINNINALDEFTPIAEKAFRASIKGIKDAFKEARIESLDLENSHKKPKGGK